MKEQHVMRHPDILEKKNTALVVVDIQEKLARSLPKYPDCEPKIRMLIQAAGILGLPVLVTEQYPKGLGTTLESIREVLNECETIEKTTFSCCSVQGFAERLRDAAVTAVILVGMEAHVCVQQTALDLLFQGFKVHVPADAVVSRHKIDWRFALERMRHAGAIITTSQAMIFELLVEAGTPDFKQILPLLKGN